MNWDFTMNVNGPAHYAFEFTHEIFALREQVHVRKVAGNLSSIYRIKDLQDAHYPTGQSKLKILFIQSEFLSLHQQ